MMTPRPAAIKTTMKPMMSDTRPPYMRRVSMSMPFPSVPSQCSAEGLAYRS